MKNRITKSRRVRSTRTKRESRSVLNRNSSLMSSEEVLQRFCNQIQVSPEKNVFAFIMKSEIQILVKDAKSVIVFKDYVPKKKTNRK